MSTNYLTKYHDDFGDEDTVTINDGKTFRMSVRGIEFIGDFFSSLKPNTDEDNDNLKTFVLARKYLSSFSVDCEVPVPITPYQKTETGLLHIHYECGKPKLNGRVEHSKLRLTLEVLGHVYKSTGSYGDDMGYFGDEALELAILLPEDTYIQSCINCRLSSYNPLGYSAFGELACFRGSKEEFLELKGKHELIQFWNKFTEYVQEIYLCPEFQPKTNIKKSSGLQIKNTKSSSRSLEYSSRHTE